MNYNVGEPYLFSCVYLNGSEWVMLACWLMFWPDSRCCLGNAIICLMILVQDGKRSCLSQVSCASSNTNHGPCCWQWGFHNTYIVIDISNFKAFFTCTSCSTLHTHITVRIRINCILLTCPAVIRSVGCLGILLNLFVCIEILHESWTVIHNLGGLDCTRP